MKHADTDRRRALPVSSVGFAGLWNLGHQSAFGYCVVDSNSMRTKSNRYWTHVRGCIQKFPDWVDIEIYAYLWYFSLLPPPPFKGLWRQNSLTK